MTSANTTSWTLIRGAAAGNSKDREMFARRYQPVAAAYLIARWGQAMANDLDDAVQDVFAECFRKQGVLDRVETGQRGGFRAFFFGVVRNIARRYESRNSRRLRSLSEGWESGSHEAVRSLQTRGTPESAFESAWARAVMKEAREVQFQRAEQLGGSAISRIELLQLRFERGLAIREIAELWKQDASHLHHQYAKAREEFHNALRQVVSGHLGEAGESIVDEECRRLLGLLSCAE